MTSPHHLRDTEHRVRRYLVAVLVLTLLNLALFAAQARAFVTADSPGITAPSSSTSTSAPAYGAIDGLAARADWLSTSSTTTPSRRPPKAVSRYVLGSDEQLACIEDHESRSSGGYSAVSPSGKYRGRSQWDQKTWDNAVAQAGHPEYAGTPANKAPEDVQDDATRWQIRADGGVKEHRWPTPARKGC